jgi:hypothetical protein
VGYANYLDGHNISCIKIGTEFFAVIYNEKATTILNTSFTWDQNKVSNNEIYVYCLLTLISKNI